MNLIHVGSSYQMGLTSQETNLAIAYKLNTKINFIALSGEKEQFIGLSSLLIKNNITHVIIPGFDEHRNFIRLIKSLIKVIRLFNPNIVTLNTNWQLVLFGVTRFFIKNKFKIIYTIHGYRHNHSIKSKIAIILISTLLHIFADLINAPSTFVKNKFPTLKRKLISIPLGEDDIFFEKSKAPNFSKPYKFCYPAVFRQGKNQLELIQAFARFIQITENLDSQLYLPGEGSLLGKAKQYAVEMGIEDRVIFPGQLDRNQMLELYLKCQFSIVCSNVETFGHCIAEPLILQRVLITRDVGIAIDVVKDNVNGLVFDTFEDLVTCLVKIDSMPKEDLMRISASASSLASIFNWKNIAIQHVEKMFRLMKNSLN